MAHFRFVRSCYSYVGTIYASNGSWKTTNSKETLLDFVSFSFVDGNVMTSPNFAVNACETRRTTRRTVDFVES